MKVKKPKQRALEFIYARVPVKLRQARCEALLVFLRGRPNPTYALSTIVYDFRRLAGCGKANFAERSPSPEMNQARISQWVLMVKRFEAIVAG